jgi:hypothetical protein
MAAQTDTPVRRDAALRVEPQPLASLPHGSLTSVARLRRSDTVPYITLRIGHHAFWMRPGIMAVLGQGTIVALGITGGAKGSAMKNK